MTALNVPAGQYVNGIYYTATFFGNGWMVKRWPDRKNLDKWDEQVLYDQTAFQKQWDGSVSPLTTPINVICIAIKRNSWA